MSFQIRVKRFIGLLAIIPFLVLWALLLVVEIVADWSTVRLDVLLKRYGNWIEDRFGWVKV